MSKKELTRRNFLKLGAVTSVGLAAAACGAQTPAPAPEAPPPAQPDAPAAEPTAAPAAEAPAAAGKYKEAPMLAERVQAGQLPPVDERLPENPLVVEPVEEIGVYGGTWRLLVGGDDLGQAKMHYHVEPFMKWNRNVVGARPNLVEKWEWNADATVLTAQIRKGVKWSDGQPLTADDWMFYWNDLVLDESIPVVEGAGMRVGGELMTCEKVDDYTLKFTFAVPNPLFLELMSRGFYHSSWYLVPAHYMKQFHPKYEASNVNPDELMNRYNNRHQYPDMPTYMPWRTVEFRPGESARLERNPYYWKVDTAGNQLPYIDYMDVQVAESGNFSQLITLKAIAGELDMQVRDFPVQDFPTIMENQEKGDYRVIRWERGDYAWPWIMLMYDYPKDKYIEDLMYNQKFRQALSVAINRVRINEIAALGLATPRQFSLSPESPEFQTPEGKAVYEAWSTSYAQYDPEQAKAWLDEIGLKDVNGDGFREREDGSPLDLIVEVSIGDPQSVDSCDLLKEDWDAVGLKTTISAVDWSIMDQHASTGELMIRAWGSAAAWGLISASPVWTPVEGVTYCGGGQRIGQYYQTGGREGVAPRAGSHLEKLQQAYTELLTIIDPAERDAALLAAYQIHIDEGPITIGTVGQHPSPVVVKNNFRNVPAFGLVAGWDLGFPGTADPEQFFIKA